MPDLAGMGPPRLGQILICLDPAFTTIKIINGNKFCVVLQRERERENTVAKHKLHSHHSAGSCNYYP